MEERQPQEHVKYLYQHESETPGVGITHIGYIKSKVNKICKEGFRGALPRSRTVTYIFGEQPTRRALAGENKYAIFKEMTAIESGPLLTTDEAVIETVFVRHYTSLFSLMGYLLLFR